MGGVYDGGNQSTEDPQVGERPVGIGAVDEEKGEEGGDVGVHGGQRRFALLKTLLKTLGGGGVWALNSSLYSSFGWSVESGWDSKRKGVSLPGRSTGRALQPAVS